jgi:Polymorphic toxin system, DSP-PTPase phosphatase
LVTNDTTPAQPDLPDSYWVDAGALLAGEYPGSWEDAESAARLEALREAGVTSFIDLTEEGELPPYQPLLRAGVRYRRLAVHDFGVPSEAEMRAMLDVVEGELGRGETVYLHCWGGVGRTGTLVACWLVRHGLGADEALARLGELRAHCAKAERRSPETDAQHAFVRGWRRDS